MENRNKELLQEAPRVFICDKGRDGERIDGERDRLYRKVGQLQGEVDLSACGHAQAGREEVWSCPVQALKRFKKSWAT